MDDALLRMDAIAEPMREAIEDFANLVRELAGSGAQALTVYGALAAGTFDVESQSARSVLVVEKVDLTMLRRLSEHGAKLGKAHIVAPLVMTPDYIKESLDTFPLELMEIHQNHLTVFGNDLFDDLTFEDRHIRLQCERELKVAAIALRQGLLAAAGREKWIGALVMDTAEGLLRTLRGMLWLKGQREAKPARAVVSEIEKVTDRKMSGIRGALDLKGHHGWAEFEQLYHDVEALGELVNAW